MNEPSGTPDVRHPGAEGADRVDFEALASEETMRGLVERYDRPGPRYTSYPTAVQFSEEFRARDYEACLRDAGARGERTLGIYIHVPFCRERCTYCGCHVIPTRRVEVADAYVSALGTEIDLVSRYLGEGPSGNRRSVHVLHVGGGTPTYLSAAQFGAVLGDLTRHLPLEPDAEVSIEVDPRVTTVEQLEALRHLGFNRASLGVQDFTPSVQEAIGRHQTLEETRTIYEAARRLGFESVNFDLVYGLPGQSAETLERTLEEALRMRPDRIAFYGYAHVPWIRHNQRGIDASLLPEGYDKLKLFLQAHGTFTGAGYRQIGMDHFALPGDDLAVARAEGKLGRNFMGYTPHASMEILGLGCSSIGSLSGAYVQNHKKLADYYRSLEAGALPVERGVFSNADDELRRWVIHQILCQFRVEAGRFEQLFGAGFRETFPSEREALTPFLRDGLVNLPGDDLHVTPLGRIFVRNVAMVFDRYLQEASSAEKGRFSRTV